jgi:hypothetical protein
MAQRFSDSITFGTVAADVALVPAAPSHVNLYLEDAQAALGTATALTRPLAFDWRLGNRFGPIWPLNRSFASFAAHVELKPTLEVKILMEADATGLGLYTTMRANAAKFLRMEAFGGTITGGGTIYTLRNDTSLKVTNVSPFRDESGIYAIEWTFAGQYDSTWGQTTQWVVTNGISAL